MIDQFQVGLLIKKQNNPLSDVIIRAISNPQVYGNRVLYSASDKFSISDENGKFLLEDLCDQEDSLIFSRIGYQDTLISLDVDFWTVSLTETSVELENVLISDERENNLELRHYLNNQLFLKIKLLTGPHH